jgi:hypothetical protein
MRTVLLPHRLRERASDAPPFARKGEPLRPDRPRIVAFASAALGPFSARAKNGCGKLLVHPWRRLFQDRPLS